MSYEEQYLHNLQYILDKGSWEYNERTNSRCLTVPKLIMEYKLDSKSIPLLTTRPSYPVSAWAELLGYFRRYDNADMFAYIGSKTWYKNANETQAWLDNPYRQEDNHLGNVYGAGLRKEDIVSVWDNIEKGFDDRGLLFNFWQPHMFDKAALRPCMNQHNINFINNVTYLTSTQRSCDYLCGKNYNALQVYFLGMLASHISGKEGGDATHVMNNVHIYEQHLEGVEELLTRKPKPLDVELTLNPEITKGSHIHSSSLHARDYFTLEGYKGVSQERINFEMVA